MPRSMTNYELARKTVSTMLGFRRIGPGDDGQITDEMLAPFMDKALLAAEAGTPMEFMLLGFPFKSGNRQKVLGDYPDMAEMLSLKWLNKVAAECEQVYEAGVKIIIGSDGLALNDLLYEKDDTVQAYFTEVGDQMAREGFTHLTYWGLQQQFPHVTDPTELRNLIPIAEGRDVASLREQILDDPVLMYYVNGVSRFLNEDLQVQLAGQMSKTAIEKAARNAAYKVVERGDGLRILYKEQFPNAIRLSVHPQAYGSDKIGIQMSDTEQNLWITPWHGVAAEVAPGKFGMFKLSAIKDSITKFVEDSFGRPQYVLTY